MPSVSLWWLLIWPTMPYHKRRDTMPLKHILISNLYIYIYLFYIFALKCKNNISETNLNNLNVITNFYFYSFIILMIDFNITFKLNVYFSIKLDFCPVILKSLALLLNPLLFFSVDSPQHPPPTTLLWILLSPNIHIFGVKIWVWSCTDRYRIQLLLKVH